MTDISTEISDPAKGNGAPPTQPVLSEVMAITPPRFETAMYKISGVAPYMQARFSEKSKLQMRAKHVAGSQGGKGKKREARDFDADYKGALYVASEGWYGIPAGAFRSAAISACRLVGFRMTMAKLSVFIEADGYDKRDGTPMVRIIEGEPEKNEMMARNANGSADIRIRPLWRKWVCNLRIRYDLDQFSRTDVANLLLRMGMQVGVGEGRPDSKSSNGLGFGLFESVALGDLPPEAAPRPKSKKKRV